MSIIMTRSEAKEYIERHPEGYLERDKSGKGYICPICGSGSGKKGTGITTKDGEHYTCWAGCFKWNDIFDVIGMEQGLDLNDFNVKLNAAAEIYGIELVNDDNYKGKSADQDFGDLDRKNWTTQVGEKKQELDYTEYFETCAKRIEETNYHRGITLETLKKFKIGYDPKTRQPKRYSDPEDAFLIIPKDEQHYTMRYAGSRKYIGYDGQEYKVFHVNGSRLFNCSALRQGRPVFIVEGEIDALSIIDVGGEAVGLGSTSNARKLVDLLRENGAVAPLILALDNDESGNKKAEELRSELQKLSIPYVDFTYPDGCKDANDVLVEDRDLLKKLVQDAELGAISKSEDQSNDDIISLERDSNAHAMEDFMLRIGRGNTERTFIPTGFPSLDSVLEGGLYPGLYVIGAVSSLGKTSFCLQIADQIASSGKNIDVLIFSLEMSRDELIAKSISRLTYELEMKEDGNVDGRHSKAKTTLGILVGSRYNGYTAEELDLIEEAVGVYSGDYSSHLYIHEGMGNIGVNEIRKEVDRMKRIKGSAPVVIVDYLQILSPSSDAMIRATDKQIVDKNVLELKRLSRDYKIPVIGISSFNRDNYENPLNLSAFKESGAIEYGSDVLLGMQYDGMDYEDGEKDNSPNRTKRIRGLKKTNEMLAKDGGSYPIEVKILKNRNGNRGTVGLWFCPMFNCYSETQPLRYGRKSYDDLLKENMESSKDEADDFMADTNKRKK